jgi:hypothetical protein
MTADYFHMDAHWHNRLDPFGDFVRDIERTLDAVSGICPYCDDLLVVDHTRPGYGPGNQILHNAQLAEMRHRMAEFLESGVVCDDFDVPDPTEGYHLAAVNEAEMTPRSISMEFYGAFTQAIGSRDGRVALTTDYDHEADPKIASLPVMRALVHALIEIWRPEDARVTRRALLDLGQRRGEHFDVAWMSYLSPPLAARITPPDTIMVERDADCGLLMIAAEETFDIANPAHVAGAYAIREATVPLNPPLRPPWPPWRPNP